MTIPSTTRRLAYYTGCCALLMLAMSTSKADDCEDVALVANDDSFLTEPGVVSGRLIHLDVLDNDVFMNDDLGDGHCFDGLTVTSPPTPDGQAVPAAADTDVGRDHIHYTSAAGFGGTDTFSYAIVNVTAVESVPAEVTILVDGTVSETTAGSNRIAFGGAFYGGSPLSATGELAENPGTSTVECCTVLDPRVGAGNIKKDGPTAFNWVSLDLGGAMSSALGDEDCAGISPGPGVLIVPRHFGVHTQTLGSQIPADYRFGVCRVQTDVIWKGPVAMDVVSMPVVGYPVKCKESELGPSELPLTVDKQPLTLGLSTDPAEFTSPDMRAVSSDCDPRSVTKWSTWFFVVNAVHLTGKEDSRTYVGRMSSVLKNLIEAMRGEGAAENSFLDEIKGLVVEAEEPYSSKKAKSANFQLSMDKLDDATLLALAGDEETYSSTASFKNPEGELVSHLTALRYAVCSELQWPTELEQCAMDAFVVAALPPLAGQD